MAGETTYCGYRWDANSGLLAVRNRYYHPLLGRWLTRDPISYLSGMNLYGAYFAPDGVDPLGLSPNPRPQPPRQPLPQPQPRTHLRIYEPPTELVPFRPLVAPRPPLWAENLPPGWEWVEPREPYVVPEIGVPGRGHSSRTRTAPFFNYPLVPPRRTFPRTPRSPFSAPPRCTVPAPHSSAGSGPSNQPGASSPPLPARITYGLPSPQLGCNPCGPPVGTIAYELHSAAAGNEPHDSMENHYHWFIMNQSPPPICRCFWNRRRIDPTDAAFGVYSGTVPYTLPSGGGVQ